jgi:hypothetical protein
MLADPIVEARKGAQLRLEYRSSVPATGRDQRSRSGGQTEAQEIASVDPMNDLSHGSGTSLDTSR